MTRKDAIKTLKELWRETNDPWYEEVYNMAINALKADRNTEPPKDLVKESPSLVKDLVKAFGEDGTWLERQGVYTLTLAEAKQRAVDIIESVLAKTEPQTSGLPYKVETSSVCKTEPQTDCAWGKGE